MRKRKGYTLIELLLSVTLITMFFGASIIYTSLDARHQIQIESKVSNYISLNKYIKYHGELNGKETKLLIISNKVEAVIKNDGGDYKNILPLQVQVEDLNDGAYFDSSNEDIMTYFPDGSEENNGTITLSIDDTNNALINIEGWNCVNIIYTNIINNTIAN